MSKRRRPSCCTSLLLDGKHVNKICKFCGNHVVPEGGFDDQRSDLALYEELRQDDDLSSEGSVAAGDEEDAMAFPASTPAGAVGAQDFPFWDPGTSPPIVPVE